MCTPIGMAFVGAFQAQMENQAANQLHDYKLRLQQAGEDSAILANANKQRQLGTQTQQKLRSAGEEIRMIQRKGNRVAATAAVRATKGGVQADSVSVQALQEQFGRDALQAIGVREVEGEEILTFSQQQAKAIEFETQARIDSVQAGPAPSKPGQLVNLAIGAAKGYYSALPEESGLVPLAGSSSSASAMTDLASTTSLINAGAGATALPSVAAVGGSSSLLDAGLAGAFTPLQTINTASQGFKFPGLSIDSAWANWDPMQNGNPFALR